MTTCSNTDVSNISLHIKIRLTAGVLAVIALGIVLTVYSLRQSGKHA